MNKVTEFVMTVKNNPGTSVVLLVIGFTLGALHHYFGL